MREELARGEKEKALAPTARLSRSPTPRALYYPSACYAGYLYTEFEVNSCLFFFRDFYSASLSFLCSNVAINKIMIMREKKVKIKKHLLYNIAQVKIEIQLSQLKWIRGQLLSFY